MINNVSEGTLPLGCKMSENRKSQLESYHMPTRAAPHLGHATHAPEVFKEDHKGEVDIWSVGKLVVE